MGEIPFSQGSIRNQGANIRIVSQPSKGDNVACRGTQIPGARASSLSRVYAVTNHASTAPRQVREVHTYVSRGKFAPTAGPPSCIEAQGGVATRPVTTSEKRRRNEKHQARSRFWAGHPGSQRTIPSFSVSLASNGPPAFCVVLGGSLNSVARDWLWFRVSCAVNPGPTPPYFRAAKACAQCYLPARSRSFSPRKVNDSAPGGYKGKVLFIMNDRGWLAAVIAELYWWAFDVPSRGISSISLYFFTDTAPETSLDTANGEEKNYPTANVLEAARRNERVPVRVQHQAAKVCLHPARKLPVLPLTLQPSVIAMNRSQIVLAQNFLLTQSTSARNGLWRSCYASISSTCLHATRSFST
ncbi:hypothetical protein CISG_08167 [Coccidioides immitis RMSCC 3703]|uniref:Uncharacterized protein n=1 Tax=Coccidioides immitis RMSCC 3703 TaxID=454286 RepID=A0A0J8U107_COCIT|nr:hypothetical protein CISG_08167 [Coccidioides immitis RMSCC 3703]